MCLYVLICAHKPKHTHTHSKNICPYMSLYVLICAHKPKHTHTHTQQKKQKKKKRGKRWKKREKTEAKKHTQQQSQRKKNLRLEAYREQHSGDEREDVCAHTHERHDLCRVQSVAPGAAFRV